MICFFKRSRHMAWILGVLLGLVGGALGWVLAQERLAGLGGQLAVAALAAFLGVYLALYAARITATKEYQTILLYLYEDLNPEKFLAAALPLRKARMDPSLRGTAMAHIANGFLYAGQFQEALEVLDSIQAPEKAVELRGLVLGNQAACQLLAGQEEAAREQICQLRHLITQKGCKPEFAKKARHTIAYLELCLDIQSGRKVDPQVLERDFSSSHAPLHRLDVQFRLAQIYSRCGRSEDFQSSKAYVLHHGGKTVLPSLLP